ncbi:myozenin-1b [Eucyclogobius newberryi]|uniref:myozenin-1b n=1 Tax=Eucyclogobius newberryi TaxID=166745 RepID=UPI003B5A5EA4
MPLTTADPPNKRKKVNKIITDLTNISQNDDELDSEATAFDLGTKIKTPKDVMLEELSLMKNKGSKMFQMRQQRVERFIVSDQNMDNLENLLILPPLPPPKPVIIKQEDKPEVNEAELKERRRKQYVRTYVSPWERAMRGDEILVATMKGCMPGPIQAHVDLPLYKSFNRTALPFRGPEKASKVLTFEMPEVTQDEPEPLPGQQSDVRSRPSFNRTPIGWVCSEDDPPTPLEQDNVPFDGETEDL